MKKKAIMQIYRTEFEFSTLRLHRLNFNDILSNSIRLKANYKIRNMFGKLA